jgi:S-adenosylmethionine synthetase
MVDAFGTESVSEERITSLVRENFSLTPKGVIEALDLRRPIYKATAAYGHFGRSGPGFTWERTDRAGALRKAAGLSASASASVEVGARA